MPKREEILSAIVEAFGTVPRPDHFTNYTHCDECAEHDETLRSQTPATIGLEQLGNPGWDPVCFINSPAGLKYYMPALARLALDPSDSSYLLQFIFHLNEERIASFDESQKRAVLSLFEYLLEDPPFEINDGPGADDLLRVASLLMR
jgi:hypothetical protein